MKKTIFNGPTILTMLRIFLSVVFFVFMLLPNTWAKIVALVIFVVASISDYIDGKWARKKKIVTEFGSFLDPLADKMLVNLAFLALVYLNVIPVWIFAIILVRDFAVDGLRMMAARSGKTLSASFFGKLKTTFQMIALAIIISNTFISSNELTILGNTILYIALILTIWSGVDYFIKDWKRLIK